MNKLLEKLSLGMAAIAAVALVFVMLFMFVDVVGRYFFNAPLTFSVELVELGVGLMLMFGLAITTLRGGHISVDLLSGPAGSVRRRVLDAVANLAALIFIALMTWRLFDRAQSFRSDGLGTQILFLPVHPVVYLMAAGAAVAVVVALYRLLRPASAAQPNSIADTDATID